MATSRQRMALKAALLITPDDRAATRSAIVRASVHALRNGGVLRAPDSKRILRPFKGAQRSWVALGVALYQVFYTRPLVPVAFVACVLLLLVQLIISLI
jgi:hypothetical protein